MATKRRGGQTKEERIQARIDRMEMKLQTAILEGNETVVANYLKYIAILDKAAKGELKGVSVTNQISSAKVLIEKAEAILAKETGKVEQEEVVEEEEKFEPFMNIVNMQE